MALTLCRTRGGRRDRAHRDQDDTFSGTDFEKADFLSRCRMSHGAHSACSGMFGEKQHLQQHGKHRDRPGEMARFDGGGHVPKCAHGSLRFWTQHVGHVDGKEKSYAQRRGMNGQDQLANWSHLGNALRDRDRRFRASRSGPEEADFCICAWCKVRWRPRRSSGGRRESPDADAARDQATYRVGLRFRRPRQ